MADWGQVPRPRCRCQSCPALGQRVHLWSPAFGKTIRHWDTVYGSLRQVCKCDKSYTKSFKDCNLYSNLCLVCYFRRNNTVKHPVWLCSASKSFYIFTSLFLKGLLKGYSYYWTLAIISWMPSFCLIQFEVQIYDHVEAYTNVFLTFCPPHINISIL